MISFFLLYKNIPHPVYPVCSTTTTANWEYPVFHALLLCNNTKIIEKFKYYTNTQISQPVFPAGSLLKQTINRYCNIINGTQCRSARVLYISVVQEIGTAKFNRRMLFYKPVVHLRVDRIKC